MHTQDILQRKINYMAVVAQLVERRFVVPNVAGSRPVDRPIKTIMHQCIIFFKSKNRLKKLKRRCLSSIHLEISPLLPLFQVFSKDSATEYNEQSVEQNAPTPILHKKYRLKLQALTGSAWLYLEVYPFELIKTRLPCNWIYTPPSFYSFSDEMLKLNSIFLK